MVNNLTSEGFNNLSTVKFQEKMKPAALKIYKQVFGENCEIEDLREDGFKVHILDKEFGIDAMLSLPTGQWLTLQEKYRKNYYISFLDFTQEYKNAEGTEHESNGEWFSLGAQLYFYGWSNKDETDFEKWIILDIVRYKLIIEKLGGLSKAGYKLYNRQYGRASFYSINLRLIEDAIIFSNFFKK